MLSLCECVSILIHLRTPADDYKVRELCSNVLHYKYVFIINDKFLAIKFNKTCVERDLWSDIPAVLGFKRVKGYICG